VVNGERWGDNWRVVSAANAVCLEVPRSRSDRRALIRTVGDLPSDTPVVLTASAPWATRRCREFASEAGVELDAHYLAFPSAAAPAYLVEDDPAPIRFFVSSILTAPSRGVRGAPLDAALKVLRTLNTPRLVRSLAPGRIAVGRRS